MLSINIGMYIHASVCILHNSISIYTICNVHKMNLRVSPTHSPNIHMTRHRQKVSCDSLLRFAFATTQLDNWILGLFPVTKNRKYTSPLLLLWYDDLLCDYACCLWNLWPPREIEVIINLYLFITQVLNFVQQFS